MERGVCVCVSEHRCGSSAAKPNSLVRLQATPQPNRHINHRNRIQFYHQPWPFFFFSISRSLFVACISSSLILRLLQLLYLHCHWQQCSLATLCSINNTNKMLGKCEKNIMNHMQCGPSHALTNQQIIKKKKSVHGLHEHGRNDWGSDNRNSGELWMCTRWTNISIYDARI